VSLPGPPVMARASLLKREAQLWAYSALLLRTMYYFEHLSTLFKCVNAGTNNYSDHEAVLDFCLQ
jgi:hypothetical protein